MSLSRPGRAVTLGLVAAIVAAGGIALRHADALQVLERPSIDARYALEPARPAPRGIAVVGIDETTLQQMGVSYSDFKRRWDATVIRRLHTAGARLIVSDIQFTGRTNPRDDSSLTGALAAASPVVLATSPQQSPTASGLYLTEKQLADRGDQPAEDLLPTDPGAVIRQMSAGEGWLPSLANAALYELTDHLLSPALMAHTGGWIDYSRRQPPLISFIDVLDDHFNPALVRGKVVILGAVAPEIGDVHATPVEAEMAGPVILANEIATAVAGLPLRNASATLEILLLITGALLPALIAMRCGPLWVLGTGAVELAGWCVSCQFVFDGGRVLAFTPELLVILGSNAACASVAAAARGRELARLRRRFAAGDSVVVAGALSGHPGGGLAATQVIAGYRLEEELSRGGMGVVYRAVQLDLGRTVALKLIRPELADDPTHRRRFELESHAAAAIEHPNVIPVYGSGEDSGLLYIAMRLVNGADLGTLSNRGRLDPVRAVRIVEQIAGALDAAHALGMVHRDVKPGNVLVSYEQPEHAYLTDFGVAKWLAGESQLTRAEHIVGTADYAAPEQLLGEAVDGRTDIYALAAVLYASLTGSPPFVRAGFREMLAAHTTAPRPTLGADTAVLNDVIVTGMAIDPRERYASAGALAVAATTALGIHSLLGDPPPGPAETPAADPASTTVAGGATDDATDRVVR